MNYVCKVNIFFAHAGPADNIPQAFLRKTDEGRVHNYKKYHFIAFLHTFPYPKGRDTQECSEEMKAKRA